ncbi:MAG TPA: RNA polymerase sigma factor [Allosphingosinicella sp.]|nr:RNA polymerase sigma factor [Allosphingosinicella sp.]
MEAFERELLTLLPRLRRFARSLARDAADADDLTQLALERALKARAQWQKGTRMDSWMMKIMRNCWIDEVRSRARRAAALGSEDVRAVMPAATASEAERAADADAIDRAMNALPVEQREAVALVLVEGLSYREAAEMLDVPVGTLTSRLTRGRQALARTLEAA